MAVTGRNCTLRVLVAPGVRFASALQLPERLGEHEIATENAGSVTL
jgi:hypothetical protein